MRDRLADWMFALALASSVTESIALEVRLGQRSEVAELAEGAAAVRAGSSSMPHKSNPITSEKICGLARLIRGYINPVLDGVALWHERDLTHSSVERVAVPDAAALTEHVLASTVEVMSNLVVNTDQMRTAVALDPVAILSNGALVRLTDAGVPWAVARRIVERAAKQEAASSVPEFVARLSTLVASEHPEISDRWAAGLDQPDPVRLDTVFDRLGQIDVQG
jgi:adenylosuccinate lyase